MSCDLMSLIGLVLIIWALIGVQQSRMSGIGKLISVLLLLPIACVLLRNLTGPGNRGVPRRR